MAAPFARAQGMPWAKCGFFCLLFIFKANVIIIFVLICTTERFTAASALHFQPHVRAALELSYCVNLNHARFSFKILLIVAFHRLLGPGISPPDIPILLPPNIQSKSRKSRIPGGEIGSGITLTVSISDQRPLLAEGRPGKSRREIHPALLALARATRCLSQRVYCILPAFRI